MYGALVCDWVYWNLPPIPRRRDQSVMTMRIFFFLTRLQINFSCRIVSCLVPSSLLSATHCERRLARRALVTLDAGGH